ncbi:MAG: MinD/ParA family protein [Vicinamibacterales bacterium]
MSLVLSKTAPRRMVTLAVTSGKGGVGKTNVAINLAVGLARLKNRVGILDADFALGNVDVMLGLAPQRHLGHLLAGEATVDAIAVDGPDGVRIIPASSGLRELTALSPSHWQRLSAAIDALRDDLDFLIIDTATGISGDAVELLLGADRVLVVTSPEPPAMVDAYALIKVLTRAEPSGEIGLLVNGARDLEEADSVFQQLDRAAARFLNRQLRYYGFIARDPAVRASVQMQRPVVDLRPQSAASRCFRILASRVAGFSVHGGGLRLVQPASASVTKTEREAPQCA